jgi:hypothetical protein
MNARRITTVVAGLLYTASLLLPAGWIVIKPLFGETTTLDQPYYGINAFLVGMAAVLTPTWQCFWLFLAWLANPMFWMGLFWCVRGRTERSATAALVSAGLGLLIIVMSRELVPGPGYWVWLASFLALFAGSSLCSVVRSSVTPVPNAKNRV